MEGSSWRKWDMHIHTPDTYLNNQFTAENGDDVWETYLKKIEAVDDIKVLGITEYFSVDAYKKVLEYKKDGRLGNIELLIPNVELRLLPVTKTETPINFHILFAPEIIEDLETLFFSQLKVQYKDDPYTCTRRDLIRLGRAYRGNQNLEESTALEEGVNQFKVELTLLRNIFNASQRLQKYSLKGVSNSSNDGNSGIQHSSLATTRQEIYRFADFIFSGNPSDRKYFIGQGVDKKEKIVNDYGSLKPCLHGCDAHQNSKICKPDKDRYTFIKADTTFEGLKQIIYEPEHRVYIGETAPILPPLRIEDIMLKFPLGSKFEGEVFCLSGEKNITLSPYFTCIIGGRGTGKSTLLNIIHEKLKTGENKFFRSKSIKNNSNRTLSIGEHCIIDNDKDEKYIEFLSQNEIEEFALDYTKLTTAIYSRIIKRDEDGKITKREEDLKAAINELSINITYKLQIKDLYSAIVLAEKECEANKRIVDSFSSEEYVDITSRIRKLNSSISSIETSKRKYFSAKEKIKAIVDSYEKDEGANAYSLKANQLVDSINALLETAKDDDFTEPESQLKEFLTEINSCKLELKEYLSSKGLTEENLKDISNANILINTFQEDIKLKRIEISKLEKRIDAFDKNALRQKSDFFKTELEAQAKSISTILESIKSESVKPISIVFEFDMEAACDAILEEFKLTFKVALSQVSFQSSILPTILFSIEPSNLSSKEDLIEAIESQSTSSAIKPFMAELFDEEYNFRLYKLIVNKHLYNFSDYKKVKVTYDGRSIEHSSFGQRCTAVLIILLLLGNNPIIIDEPEAHLDSHLIANYLVDVIKNSKRNRQIVFATHNANFVINGDAELIYILEVDDLTKLTQLTATTIEFEGTKNILIGLEGGKEAFKKRNGKYFS